MHSWEVWMTTARELGSNSDNLVWQRRFWDMHRIAKSIFLLSPLADLNKIVLTNAAHSDWPQKNSTLKCDLKALPERAVWKINILEQGLHWIDRKLEVKFQITASTCSGFCSFTSQHQHCHSIPEKWWKDQGAHLEGGAVPASRPLWGSAASHSSAVGSAAPRTLQSPPTANSSLLWFVSREAKGDRGSCSILAEIKLYWLSCPQKPNTSEISAAAVMTNLDSCNISAYSERTKKLQ